jgi:hypothetical protein
VAANISHLATVLERNAGGLMQNGSIRPPSRRGACRNIGARKRSLPSDTASAGHLQSPERLIEYSIGVWEVFQYLASP